MCKYDRVERLVVVLSDEVMIMVLISVYPPVQCVSMSKYYCEQMCMWPCIWTLLILFNPFLSASKACPHANALSTA